MVKDLWAKFVNKNKKPRRYISLGAVFSERCKRTVRNLFKRAIFEKGWSNSLDDLPTITKQFSNPIRFSTNLTPIEASFKKNEGFVHHSL